MMNRMCYRLIRHVGFGLLLSIGMMACQDDEASVRTVEVRRIAPDRGVTGDVIKLGGAGFTQSGKVVTFNGRKARVESIVSDTVMTVVVPGDVSTGYVSIRIGESVTTGPLFTVLKNPTPPVLTGVSAAEVEVGEVFTLTGSHFAAGSDSALARNVVRLGGVRTDVIGGTDTELKVLMPALPAARYDLTVSVLGESSAPQPVTVKGFAGTLHWGDVPGTYWTQTATQQYIITARADGGTQLTDRKVMPVPPLIRQLDFNYNARTTVAYNAASNMMVLHHNVPETGESQIYKSTPPWDNFTLMAAGTSEDVVARGLKFTNVGMLGVSSTTRSFYAYNETNGEDNRPMRYIGTGDLQTNAYRDFNGSADPVYYSQGLFTSTSVVAGTVSETYFYAHWRRLNRTTRKWYTELYRVALNEPAAVEKMATVFNDHTIIEMTHHAADGYIYMLVHNVEIVPSEYQVYRFQESNPTAFELVLNHLPTNLRNFKALTTTSGVKYYWLAPSPAGWDALWILNLKSGKDAKPMMLYDKIQEITGKPETRNDDPNFPAYLIPFMILDDE